MARRFGERPLRVHRVGLAGSNSVRFEATIRHGRGTRRIDVDVHARDILAMADAIRATANQACQHHRSRTAYPSDELSVGHAIWHLDNPDMPMPCITGDIIEIDDGNMALPEISGEEMPLQRSRPPWPRLPEEIPRQVEEASEGIDSEDPGYKSIDIYDASIEELVLSTRAISCLVRAEVHTIGELAALTSTRIRKLDDASDLVVATIRHALARVGVALADDEDDGALRSSRGPR